jgi:hypothetical protein
MWIKLGIKMNFLWLFFYWRWIIVVLLNNSHKKFPLCVSSSRSNKKNFCEWRASQLVHFFFSSIIILRSYTMPLISFLKWIIKIPSNLCATYVSQSLLFAIAKWDELIDLHELRMKYKCVMRLLWCRSHENQF